MCWSQTNLIIKLPCLFILFVFVVFIILILCIVIFWVFCLHCPIYSFLVHYHLFTNSYTILYIIIYWMIMILPLLENVKHISDTELFFKTIFTDELKFLYPTVVLLFETFEIKIFHINWEQGADKGLKTEGLFQHPKYKFHLP